MAARVIAEPQALPDKSASQAETLIEKIKQRNARVAVVGIGYVGLPLAVEFAKNGFQTVGIDTNPRAVDQIILHQPTTIDVTADSIARLHEAGLLSATESFDVLGDCDAICVCVPTPLTPNREPDVSHVRAAAGEIAARLRPGQLVVLESTSFPGTTAEVVLPILAETGLQVGEDFFLGYSPERVDPGNNEHTIANTPKLVAGITPTCREAVAALYSQIVSQIVPISSTQAAETAKLLENLFRNVNIALVNELTLLCNRMGIDVWEVIDAASTKPFGYMRFTPGPGLGGHCIPVDPYYLSWKARELGFNSRFVELASEINLEMPLYVVDKISAALNSHSKAINGSRILLLGVAYKPDISDTRESPAMTIMDELRARGAKLAYSDPYVPTFANNGAMMKSRELTVEEIKRADCVVLITDHSCYPYDLIAEHAQLLVDTRNAFKNWRRPGIYHL